MSAHIDLFYNTYANFTEQVLASVRAETYGEDLTAERRLSRIAYVAEK